MAATNGRAGSPASGAGGKGEQPAAAGPGTAGPGTPAGPGTASRALPPAAAGPTIIRPKAPDSGVVAPPRDKFGAARDAKAAKAAARKAAPAPKAATAPAAPAESRPRARSSAAKLQTVHAQAARRLSIPELALSGEEAADLSAAFDQLGELTGWTPTGPTFVWLSLTWTFATIYGGRMMDIMARRREADRQTESPPGPSPLPPASPDMAMQPIIIPPGPTIARPPAPPPAPSAATLDFGALGDLNAGFVAGLTPPVPGVPQTSSAERHDRL